MAPEQIHTGRGTYLAIFSWICFVLADNKTYDSSSDCSWIKCYNSGTMVEQDQHCTCHCLPGFSGILCEYEMELSSWPDGPYALLMSSTGCPEDEVYGWGQGYINMTTQYPMEIWIQTNESIPSVPISETTAKLAGPFGDYTLQLTFCFKHDDWSSQSETVWPVESISVFGVLNGCPEGMAEEDHVIALPPIRSWWSDGYLPHFEIRSNDDVTELLTKRCTFNETGSNSVNISSEPFIFVKEPGTSCIGTEMTEVKEETLTMRYGNGHGHTNITYCIYSPYENISDESNPDQARFKCGRQLGLSDGTIDDYQITASTWDKTNTPQMARGFYLGWCPAIDDQSPYLQIDLFTISLIEGITLYNQVKTTDNLEDNVYSRRLIPMGCRSFMVSHGIHPGDFTNYTERPFIVDSSQAFEVPQTFKFVRPVLARYVKVYPIEPIHGGRLCLRMELRGCPSTAKLTPICDRESHSVWIPLSNVNHSSLLTTLSATSSNISSMNDCQQACEQLRGDCKAIQYIANLTCSLYTNIYPNTSLAAHTQQQSSNALLVCLRESSILPEYIHIGLNTAAALLVGNSVITSRGYPLPYPSKAVFKWKVLSVHGGFIRLTFAVIDFYKTSIFQNFDCSEDKLTFDEAFRPITSSHNGLTPTFPTDKQQLDIVFNTCERIYLGTERRMGFRMFLKFEDSPTIWNNWINYGPPNGILMSYSLLGFYDRAQSVQKWTYHSSASGGPYRLTFWYFNVPCVDSSYLKIYDTITYNEELCNTEMKPRREYKAWVLQIQFSFQPTADVREGIGFGAYFQLVQVNEFPPWLTPADVATTELVDEMAEEDEVYHVCSTHLNKCFIYSRLHFLTDWLSHSKYCSELGYRQLVINSQKELEYSQAWMLNMEKDDLFDEYSPYPPYNIYTHIGLIRYQEKGRLQQVWQDGTTSTFSAWGPRQPHEPLTNLCTGMNVNITTGIGEWVTLPCSVVPKTRISWIFASVCEKPYKPMYSTGLSSGDIGINAEPEHKELLFHCNSTEWVIHTTVCDGIKDCSDGSDELSCDFRNRSGEVCFADDFACGSGECIHVGHVCDFIKDCQDGSDEFCTFPECTAEDYNCTNKQCVPMHARCDAIVDCYDGSDEYLCDTCNTTHAFSCGDLTCIPRSLVCDRIPHCDKRRDEKSCAKTYKTCYEYWRDGYDQNVSFTDKDTLFFIECNYYLVDTQVLRITTTMDWALQLWSHKNDIREYTDIYADYFKEHGQTCEVEISERCKYHVNEVCSYVDPAYNGTYSFCQPRSIKIYTNGSEIWTNDTLEIIRGMSVEVEGAYARLMRRIAERNDLQTNVLTYILTKVHPVICTADYSQTDINCGDGMTVSVDRRCLYDFTRAGVIDGCRNFRHLNDCDEFVCPYGYSKCPASFCLAQRFICDGQRQCPNGEDEENCWCAGDNYTLVLAYDGTLYMDRKSKISKFARQFYSKGVKLYALSYIDIGNMFDVSFKEIHPYNEALNLADGHAFLTERILVESEILQHVEGVGSVIFISIEQDVSYKHSVDFNISKFDHVYKVYVNNTIHRKAEVRNTTMGLQTVVKSFDILASIGSALFPSLCQEASSSRVKADFKCMSSTIYVPLNQTCDGISQCPYGDDEAICDFKCLQSCSCKPYVVHCQSSGIGENDLLDLDSTTRVLNISNTTAFKNGTLTIQKQFPYLLKLYASRCKLTSVKDRTFTNATSLINIDLSFNEIVALRKNTFYGLRYLKVLNLEGNARLSMIESTTFRMLIYVENISITNTRVSEILPYTFAGLNLKTLNISDNKISIIHEYAFGNLTTEEINFERNEVENFDAKMFVGVRNLHTIRSPSYKFCCYKPSSVQNDNCWPHEDEFSSCEDLMRNSILQTLLWVIGAAALIANAATFVYRLINGRKKVRKGFGMFVLNLAVSDFFMGIYLIIIASADMSFRKRYMLKDDYWRNSIWCNIAGILTTVSSEASVLLMCLITLDRVLVIKFPFGQWRFNVRSSRIAVTITWVISLVIALMPVIVQDYFQGSFYSTSGVCLAMPLTHRRPPGWLYSFLIFVALNFVAFILIAVGQLIIYIEIRKSSKRMEQFKSQRSNDISVARNLLLVLTTDFLCWFPIGVMAIMAYDGHIIPGDVYAWTAVLVLPINSALNPFLYTLSAVIGLKKNERKATSKYVSTTETTRRSNS